MCVCVCVCIYDLVKISILGVPVGSEYTSGVVSNIYIPPVISKYSISRIQIYIIQIYKIHN